MKEQLIKKVKETINKYHLIQKGEGVVIGVSGGPDSVCLLHVLYEISSELELNLCAVHINHMLRGSESEADQDYVASLCKSLGVELQVFSHDIHKISASEKISLEEAGRKVRYCDFYKVAAGIGASKIAVAHNRNDQAETIIMHLLRGSGLDGLKGMEFCSGMVIRPLLGVDRLEIEEYCRSNGLQPRIDSSNLTTVYKRNKVRLELLPLMDEIAGTSSADILCRMAEKIGDDASYINSAAQEAYEQCYQESLNPGVWLDTKMLSQLHPAIARRVVRLAVRSLKGDLNGIEGIHINDSLELAKTGKTGGVIHLPGGLRAVKSYGNLCIRRESEDTQSPPYSSTLIIPGDTPVPGIGVVIKAAITEKNIGSIEQYKHIGYNSLVQFFDYDKLGQGINIRNRLAGDVFKPVGCKGTKTLKEYFIDEKIERSIRSEIPLIAKESDIAWIVGYKISDKFKVTENTKNVLRLEFSYSSFEER